MKRQKIKLVSTFSISKKTFLFFQKTKKVELFKKPIYSIFDREIDFWSFLEYFDFVFIMKKNSGQFVTKKQTCKSLSLLKLGRSRTF